MMFKRPRLRPGKALVNAQGAAALIFLAMACSGGDQGATPSDTTDQTVLPLIWSTSSLTAPIVDIAISAGFAPRLFVVYENGEGQILSLDGDVITEPAPLNLTDIADGHRVQFLGTAITMFAGRESDGSLNLFAVSDELPTPLPLAFPKTVSNVSGLCSSPPVPGGDGTGVLRLAYWTADAPRTLVIGEVAQRDGTLYWRSETRQSLSAVPLSCSLRRPDMGANVPSIADLPYGGQILSVHVSVGGKVLIGTLGKDMREVSLRRGISVEAPGPVLAVAGASKARVGGYPNGIIALAGVIGERDYRVVFADPTLFLPDSSAN